MTREAILRAAEQLFAENGVFAVSNRRISQAAGQGNNTAVSYHFGSKVELVRAIVRKHADHIEQLRTRMVAELGAAPELRDWVSCLVRPSTEHLASLGERTWFARFGAQVMADPTLREVMLEESFSSPALHQVLQGMRRCIGDLPDEVLVGRSEMARQLMVYTCAEREYALATGIRTPWSSWHETGTALIDAIVGLWLGPVTEHP